MVAARELQRGAGVPEIVKADVWQFGSLEEWLERSSGNVVGVQGPPAVSTEDEPVILPEIPCLQALDVLSSPVGPERLDSVPCERRR